MNKDTDIFPEEAPLVVLYIKSSMCMANNGKDTKHTRHTARIIYFVRDGEKCEMHKDWLVWGRSAIGSHYYQECWWALFNIKDEIYYGNLTTDTEHLYKRGEKIQDSLYNNSSVWLD